MCILCASMSSASIDSQGTQGADLSVVAADNQGTQDSNSSTSLVAVAEPQTNNKVSWNGHASWAPSGNDDFEGISGSIMLARFCIFECGPTRVDCKDFGQKDCPRWMCPPCNGARRALDYAANHSGIRGQRASLRAMKQGDPDLYKAKVRASRIGIPEDPPGTEQGVSSLGARKSKHAHTLTQFTQAISIQSNIKMAWMDKLEYIAHLIYKKGMNLDTQALKTKNNEQWSMLTSNADILQEGIGDKHICFVNKSNSVQGSRTRTLSNSVNFETGLESQLQVDEAMAQAALVGASAGAFSGAAFGELGDLFRPKLRPTSTARASTL